LIATAWQIISTPEMHAGHCCHACAVLSAIRKARKGNHFASYSTHDQWQMADFHPLAVCTLRLAVTLHNELCTSLSQCTV